jgi:hypothetical protein
MRKIRTRLVNFRVTDEEFEQLKTATDRHGARCLSDYARSAMLNVASSRSGADPVDDKVNSLDRRLTVLERSMSRLVEALAGSKNQTVRTDT